MSPNKRWFVYYTYTLIASGYHTAGLSVCDTKEACKAECKRILASNYRAKIVQIIYGHGANPDEEETERAGDPLHQEPPAQDQN